MTVGDFIADVKNSIRATSKDDRVSGKYIHSLGKDYTSYLLSRRSMTDIYRDSSIFTEVTCIEMSRVKSDKCDIAEFRKCDKVMKSVKKLPELFNSNDGPVIISVSNITGETDYQKLRKPSDFKNQLKRRFQTATHYYYISNGYIYVLGSTPERITIIGLFSDEMEAKKFSECDQISSCASVLDSKIIIPNKFISTVKDQVVQHIVSTNRSIPQDELPDLDSNQKTKQ